MRSLFLVLISIFIHSLAFAGISATATLDKLVPAGPGQVWQVEAYTATSDASGDIASTSLGGLSGCLVKVEYDLDDTDTPSANWDMYLYEDEGTIKHDLLGGEGVNLSGTANGSVTPLVGSAYQCQPIDGNVYFVGDEMGATKTVIIKLWILR